MSVLQFTLVTVVALFVPHRCDLIATTNEGLLRGTPFISRDGRTVSSFLGVPYAEPPIGPLRFKNPIPKSKWKGIRNATKFGNVCPQFRGTVFYGDEDCLVISVYTPMLNPRKRYPVLAYIHGGRFDIRSSQQFITPEYMMDHDIVVVLIGYRLSALGFFSTLDDVIPGNMGLKDQALALRWINENIANFGGNPRKPQALCLQIVHIATFPEVPVAEYFPVMEENSTNPFIVGDPYFLTPTPVPWMIGFTVLDGIFSAIGFASLDPKAYAELDARFNEVASWGLYYNLSACNVDEVSNRIRNFYFGRDAITPSDVYKVQNMYSDGLVFAPTINALRKHRGPQYLYQDSYVGKYSLQHYMGVTKRLPQSSHSNEIIYLFKNHPPWEFPEVTGNDLIHSRTLLRFYVNFMHSGNPTSSGFNFNWPLWNFSRKFVNFSGPSEVNIQKNFLQDRMQFWANLPVRDKRDAEDLGLPVCPQE